MYFLELRDPHNASSARDELARFALSRDGLHFTPLNGGKPIPDLIPVNGSFLRDPFVGRAQDGTYHMLATDHAGHHVWKTDILHRPRCILAVCSISEISMGILAVCCISEMPMDICMFARGNMFLFCTHCLRTESCRKSVSLRWRR